MNTHLAPSIGDSGASPLVPQPLSVENPPILAFNGHGVRVFERDDVLWFRLNDVAGALGIKQPHRLIASAWCDKEGVSLNDTPSDGGVQPTTFISEGNVYLLISRSRKPEALAFTRWVNHEVLPAIRRTGRYAPTPPDQSGLVETLSHAYTELDRRLCDLERKVLPRKRGRPPGSSGPAVRDVLRDLLTGTALRVSDVRAELEASGFGAKTMYDEARRMGVRAFRQDERVWWTLPRAV
ncbi:MAG: hypothetical protein KIS66_18070 [Fimbriimonadaceae bacterium]|nr:hypothetical protein [Fimbriimonadaceae bacterium]